MAAGPWKRADDEGENIVTALNHPLRRRLLVAFAAKQSSPVELHRQLGVELSSVAYHVRALEFYGLIDKVAERPARGSVQHFYALNPVGRRAAALAESAGMIEASGEEDRESGER
jgi:predicted transcriptional regulator